MGLVETALCVRPEVSVSALPVRLHPVGAGVGEVGDWMDSVEALWLEMSLLAAGQPEEPQEEAGKLSVPAGLASGPVGVQLLAVDQLPPVVLKV